MRQSATRVAAGQGKRRGALGPEDEYITNILTGLPQLVLHTAWLSDHMEALSYFLCVGRVRGCTAVCSVHVGCKFSAHGGTMCHFGDLRQKWILREMD